MTGHPALTALSEEIIECSKCPRLVSFREKIAKDKRRQFRDFLYWGKPIPGFGDPKARLVVIGLAPAGHGVHRWATVRP